MGGYGPPPQRGMPTGYGNDDDAYGGGGGGRGRGRGGNSWQQKRGNNQSAYERRM